MALGNTIHHLVVLEIPSVSQLEGSHSSEIPISANLWEGGVTSGGISVSPKDTDANTQVFSSCSSKYLGFIFKYEAKSATVAADLSGTWGWASWLPESVRSCANPSFVAPQWVSMGETKGGRRCIFVTASRTRVRPNDAQTLNHSQNSSRPIRMLSQNSSDEPIL